MDALMNKQIGARHCADIAGVFAGEPKPTGNRRKQRLCACGCGIHTPRKNNSNRFDRFASPQCRIAFRESRGNKK